MGGTWWKAPPIAPIFWRHPGPKHNVIYFVFAVQKPANIWVKHEKTWMIHTFNPKPFGSILSFHMPVSRCWCIPQLSIRLCRHLCHHLRPTNKGSNSCNRLHYKNIQENQETLHSWKLQKKYRTSYLFSKQPIKVKACENAKLKSTISACTFIETEQETVWIYLKASAV